MDMEPLPPADDHDPAPWSQPPGPAYAPDGGTPSAQPAVARFSRRTRIGAGVLALATVGAAAWAAGTTIHSSTVHLEPAAATAGTSGPSGTSGSNRKAAGMRMGGLSGIVGSKADSSFGVTVPARRPRSATGGAAGPSGTSGASGVAPSTAAPTTATVDVNPSVVYSKVSSTTGALTGLASGTRIVARGTRNLDGSLEATAVTVVPAGPAGSSALTPHVKAHQRTKPATGSSGTSGASGASGPSGAAAAPKVRPHVGGGASAPFVLGTVSADTAAGVLTVATPWGTETVDTGSGTTTTQVVPATYADVVPGARVIVTGTRDATTHTVTATRVLIVPAGVTGYATPFAGPGGFGGFPGFGAPGGRGFGRFRGPGPAGPGDPGPATATSSAVI